MNSPGNSGTDQPAPKDKWPHMRQVAPDGRLSSFSRATVGSGAGRKHGITTRPFIWCNFKADQYTRKYGYPYADEFHNLVAPSNIRQRYRYEIFCSYRTAPDPR